MLFPIIIIINIKKEEISDSINFWRLILLMSW